MVCLTKALLINRPKSSVYKITSKGIMFRNQHKDVIGNEDLCEVSEFNQFYRNKRKYVEGYKWGKSKSDSTDDHETPTDKLIDAYREIKDDVCEALKSRLRDSDPYYFEKIVLKLLLKMGYGTDDTKVEDCLTPKSSDGGIDGIIGLDELGLSKIYIQAKRYKEDSPVRAPEINKFIGALDKLKASKDIFITCSDYAQDAKEAAKCSSKLIKLMNCSELVDLMHKYDIGVSEKKAYVIKDIDSDFFKE